MFNPLYSYTCISAPFYARPEAQLDRHECEYVQVSAGENGEGDKHQKEREKRGVYDEQKGRVQRGAGLEDFREKGHRGPRTQVGADKYFVQYR